MKRCLPKTDSIQELARFWDAHDVTDFTEELEEVDAQVFERSDFVRVPLTSTEHDALKRLAANVGVEESALVHGWVREKLHQP